MSGGEEGRWRISLVGKKDKNRLNKNTKKRNRNSNMWLVRNTERNWVDGGEEGGWRTAGDFLLVGALGGSVGGCREVEMVNKPVEDLDHLRSCGRPRQERTNYSAKNAPRWVLW